MKGKLAVFGVFILCCIFILSGCAAAPATEAVVADTATPVPAEPTATQVVPTDTPEPTPTPEPPIPCNITFDSDRDNNLEVYSMGPDGSHQTNLTNNPGDDFDPVWSPDGSEIAFSSNRKNSQGDGLFIYVMNADGNYVHQLSQQGDSRFPDWSPDGSRIAFSSQGDIYVINVDGSNELNLTQSEEKDEQPKFSPDGQQIAWLRENENDRQVFVMDVNGSNTVQVTHGGKANDAEWTVDGRIFTHWENPDGICFNCVVTADGKEVIDGGGKGTIQEFLPFWTPDGRRVEMVSGQFPSDRKWENIFLVGEVFPDMFLNLSNTDANDRNPDIPARCGPVTEAIAENPVQEQPQATQPVPTGDIVLGYAMAGDKEYKESDLLKACNELQIQCIKGKDVAQLAEQNVNAIVYVSNRWDVLGSFSQIWDAAEGKRIPVFVADAESGVQSVYNLSTESTALQTSLEWMFKEMGDKGKLAYYNFGHNDYHQELIDGMLAKHPNIQATAMPADFGGNGYNEESIAKLVKDNPDLGGIWSDDNLNAIFWGLNNIEPSPVTVCPPRGDFLQPWKERIDSGSSFKCIATLVPGGTAYEAVYVAYFVLNGSTINPEKLGGYYGNTLKYDYPIITNENLEEWLGKIDTLQSGNWDTLEMRPMTPEEIKAAWFNE